MKSRVLLPRLLPRSLLILALVACASVPSFKPSQPLEQAPSLQEGLLLCNEYRLPAEPARPVALKPFLSCLDDLQERFPGPAVGDEGFSRFRAEFRSLYGTLNDQQWSPRLGLEIEVAVHVMLRALWQVDRPFVTPLEQKLALQNFPLSSATLRAADWNVAAETMYDPRLESLKAGVASLGGGDGVKGGGAGPQAALEAPAVAELCGRYFRLRREIAYLSSLWRDQRDFAALAPRDPLNASVHAKYAFRLDAALRELQDLRPKIADARAKGSFRVLACQP